MAYYSAIKAIQEDSAIRLKFSVGKSVGEKCQSPEAIVIGWQVFDPATGAFLFEGEWLEVRDANVDLRLDLPRDDGPYRVQVAPVEDRDQFILIDARVADGKLEMTPPRVISVSAIRRERLLRAIPRAFTVPIRSFWENRKLIRSMVRRDILSRYRGSIGGAVWTFLNPLLLMATYFFVFGVVLKARFAGDTSRSGFVLYFLAGMLPWLPFSEAVARSPYVIPEHRNFVKKLVFPLETLPVNLVISGAVTEAFALLIFLAFLLTARRGIPSSLVWLPTVVVPQLFFTAGLCWFLAALGVFIRDLGQITGFVLTLWFFLTPICYPETNAIPSAIAKILGFNPILIFVRGYRAVFLEGHAPAFRPLLAMWLASFAIAVLGHAWFHKLRRNFADVI